MTKNSTDRKNPFHNFTTEALKELVEEHNLRIKTGVRESHKIKNHLPNLDAVDPDWVNRIRRGKEISEALSNRGDTK